MYCHMQTPAQGPVLRKHRACSSGLGRSVKDMQVVEPVCLPEIRIIFMKIYCTCAAE